jgi:ribose/xylose/arabinose/galactoside ABC-type transport system permease subunit
VTTGTAAPPSRRRSEQLVPRRLRQAVGRNRPFAGALGFFVVMMLAFSAISPSHYADADSYTSVFVSLPIYIMLAVTLVFVIVSGEIDLSFPAIIGLSAYVFAYSVQYSVPTIVAVGLALLVGMLCGALNGVLVTVIGLSSLVATLGMNFLLRGLVQVLSDGTGIETTFLADDPVAKVLVGEIAGFPVQMLWGLAFAAFAALLFARHRFGAHVRVAGDNPRAAREMGVSVARVKSLAFVYVGAAAALAGVFGVLINSNFYPNIGDSVLLLALAAVFVGGTPTWGGVGTVAGAVVGAFTVGFIESGIIAVGLTGFWTQFAFGTVVILSLIGHRLAQGAHARE